MILEKENLARMKQADPFDLHLSMYRGHIPIDRPIKELDFVIAYEEDANKLMEFRDRQDIAGLIQWLERGRKIMASDTHAPFPLRKT